jgi:hypothetical protein
MARVTRTRPPNAAPMQVGGRLGAGVDPQALSAVSGHQLGPGWRQGIRFPPQPGPQLASRNDRVPSGVGGWTTHGLPAGLQADTGRTALPRDGFGAPVEGSHHKISFRWRLHVLAYRPRLTSPGNWCGRRQALLAERCRRGRLRGNRALLALSHFEHGYIKMNFAEIISLNATSATSRPGDLNRRLAIGPS